MNYTREADLHDAVFARVVAYTRAIMQIVRPTHGTFLAIDGVPPLAKMYQQRNRRYMSVKEQAFKMQSRAPQQMSMWNASVVTPGTAFMKALSTYLTKHLAGADVVLSDWTAPDEGEHKIFRYLADKKAGSDAVIYGLDADMIMLSLTHPETRITLMREKEDLDVANPTTEDFDLVSIVKLGQLITGGNGLTTQAADDGIILDYIFICLLIGNDFLPPLSYIQVLNDDIDRLLSVYGAVYAKAKRRIVRRERDAHGYHVDFELVRKLLTELKDGEDAGMVAACNMYSRKTVHAPDADTQWKYYPVMHKQVPINPSKRGWRGAYYGALFPDSPDVTRVVERYLEGLEWNVGYYLANTNPANQWYYGHAYSPTILDCCNYLEANANKVTLKRYPTPEITPAIQLMCVIPPASMSIVPKALARIYTDIKYGCVHLFPTDFAVDTFLKTFVWECHPRLAPIDVDLIAKAVGDRAERNKKAAA